MRYFGIGILLALSFASSGAIAAESQPAFTGAGKSCADITWQPSALARFPNLALTCQAVLTRDGKLYAQFNGKVQRRSGDSLYIRFDGGEKVPSGDRALLIRPRTDLVVQTSKGPFKLYQAQRGQEFTIYIPSDHFILNVGDEIAVADQMPIEDVVAVTEEPTAAEEPPAPAEPAQVVEATPPPAPPVVSPPASPPTVAAAPAPQPENSPWLLLIAAVVIAVIVIGVLTMRRRSK